jgi:hypothetical protein
LNSLKIIFSAKAVLLILLFVSEFILSQSRIALHYSGYSETKNFDNQKNVLDEITSWELFLMENDVSYKVIYDDDLEPGIEDDFDILILPSVEFISIAQLEALKNFQSAGKSILSAGSKLIFNNAVGNGLSNLEDLFSLMYLKYIDGKQNSYLHTLNINPLNKFNLNETGTIQISNRNRLVYNEIHNSEENSCGYLIYQENQNKNTSIRYGTIGKSRFFWTGFGLNDVVGEKDDITNFHQLILNALDWMDNKPDVYLSFEFWGSKLPSILFIENNNALEPELLDVLIKNNFHPQIVINHQSTIPAFITDQSENDALVLDLTNLSENNSDIENLSLVISDFEKNNNVKVISAFVNEFLTKSEYLKMFINFGIKNIFVNSNISGSPILHSEDLVTYSISKKNQDDFGNGILQLYYSPKFNCKENTEDSLLTVLNNIDLKKYSFVTAKVLINGWKIRENVSVKNIVAYDNRLEFVVSNQNVVEVNNIPVYINLPNNINGDNISITSNNISLILDYDLKNNLIKINIDRLFAKSNRKIVVNYNRELGE